MMGRDRGLDQPRRRASSRPCCTGTPDHLVAPARGENLMLASNDDVDIGRWIDAPFRDALLEEAAGVLMQRRSSSAQEAAAYLRGTADALEVDLCGLALLVVDSTRH